MGQKKLEGGITGKGFVKGDPRINRKGRPKSRDELQTLIRNIAREDAITPDGKPLVVNGRKISVLEAMMRGWAQSRDVKAQRLFIEFGYGKPTESIEHTGTDGEPIKVLIEYADPAPDLT